MRLHSEQCEVCGKYKKVWRKTPAPHECRGCFFTRTGTKPWKKKVKKVRERPNILAGLLPAGVLKVAK